ncbi:MAG: S8 family serine peptidase [Alphaproteobacteria bacterium]
MKLFWLGTGAVIALVAGQAEAAGITDTVTPLITAKAATATNYSTPWLNQISLPTTTTTGAKGGAGVIIGIVDTGIIASNSEVIGRVSALSSCAAVSFKCSNGVTDDQGHGTAVASIAAGAFTGTTALMSGVASGVTIVSEKSMSAQGTGFDIDIANGITKAADAGATVINLSLTYMPTSNIVKAMNYAASKGAVLVYAGGNESTTLLSGGNTTGLTQATLTHLLIAGSVNSANAKSSFSNTPGTGTATAAATTTTAAKTVSYTSLWLMAPGENIVAPAINYGATALGAWSGTSMAAPVVTGAVALLQKTWPALTRNGTAAAVLLATATDLGAAGADSTYGVGLLNLTKAFSPLGALSAVSPTGTSIALGSSSTATLTSTTLGSLKSLGTALNNYTVFDGYSRNFAANLSTLISKPAGTAVSLSSLTYNPVWTNSLKLAGGGEIEIYRDTLSTLAKDRFDRGAYRLGGAAPQPPINYLAYTTSAGFSVAGGYGLSASSFFDHALWGSQSMGEIGLGGLNALAQGGYSANLGAPITENLRLAAGWSQTPEPDQPLAMQGANARVARSASLGLTAQGAGPIAFGVKVSALDETSGLLGASYGPMSALNFGQGGTSYEAEITTVVDLGAGRSLSFSFADARTPSRDITQGLISHVSDLKSQGYGIALTLPSLAAKGDRLTLSAKQPLQLRSGYVALAQTEVDGEGYNHTTVADTALRSGPMETDMAVSYARMMGKQTYVQADLTWRTNAPQAASDLAVRGVIQKRF